MCGIIGMVSTNTYGFTWADQKIFNQLLWANTLRGEDSTGVFGVNKYGNVKFLKSAGHAGVMQLSDEFEEFGKELISDMRMVVGHNRKATRGAVSDENAHPFVEGDTILVHNGTINNQTELTKEVVDVDSKAILHSIVKEGIDDTIKKINGAFTLVWYNSTEKVLRAIRNSQRPLFIANTVGSWVFASEKGMLEWILGREGREIQEITECVPGTMYEFKLDDDKHNMFMYPKELYTPPTQQVHSFRKEEKKKKEDTDRFVGSDFIIGTKLIFEAAKFNKLRKPLNTATHILEGTWFNSDKVICKVFVEPEEVEFIEKVVAEKDYIQFVLKQVVTKDKDVTLIGHMPIKYHSVHTMDGQEILEDDFMLTDQQCCSCKQKVTFEDLRHGEFMYTNPNQYYISCDTCSLWSNMGRYC